jgi:hypothetical protein
MSSSSTTEHGLQLSQFDQNDYPKWLDDYNTDMEKIDQGVSQKAPINHATTSTTYGVATTTQYGHIRLQDIYPVGAIYESTSSTSPATLFGGTWESYGAGRVLVGAGTSDAAYMAGSTGGESNHTLTVAEMPSHKHGLRVGITFETPGNDRSAATTNSVFSTSDDYQIQPVGGGGSHNNMPPYYVVYMWRRTA